MSNRRAFTLIELLVVVAIIGILAAVGVVAYNGYTGAAKRNGTIANHNTLKKWVQLQIMKCEIDPNGKIIFRENFKDRMGHFNCPINANASIPYFVDHFYYEGWTNLYGTTPRPVGDAYYESKMHKNINFGSIELKGLNAKTFQLTTYYLDQDKNPQSLIDTLTIE